MVLGKTDRLDSSLLEDAPPAHLPLVFEDWFARQGWRPHPHQVELLRMAEAGRSALLIAPTGAGKTLAGFLPSLIDLAEGRHQGIHTLYVSPLKALATDIRRNLQTPIDEIGLPIRAETRTGDTKTAERQRQKLDPPHILLTTPESLALLLSYPEAAEMFQDLRTLIVDEIHALVGTKRGDLLSLGMARLVRLSPGLRMVGLSATVAWPDDLRRFLGPKSEAIATIHGAPTPDPEVTILNRTAEPLPWAGHMALHATAELYRTIQAHRTTLIFVNTRAQAELVFQALWRINDLNLPIGIHHGSLSQEQRLKAEAAMAAGELRAVVATSSLDLGVDWAGIDLVVQVGAPKGVSRLMQRIGRANHRFDAASKALLVPANRFEVLECQAAIQAIHAHELDGDRPRPGGLDVLAQHVTGMACAGPFTAEDLYQEVRWAGPYAMLSRRDFDDVLGFVENGGYVLQSYDRFRRLFLDSTGHYHLVSQQAAKRYRMNIGTIIEAVLLKVRLVRGPILGEVEEYFASTLRPGDTFLFAGELLAFHEIKDMTIFCARAAGKGEPKIPAYEGGRLPLSTHLADRVRAILTDPACWSSLPEPVHEWLDLQQARSIMPPSDGLLIETFPRGERWFLVAYCFEGRNAHQTLGMLLTRRMERFGLRPQGFTASDYALAVWSGREAAKVEDLFSHEMLGDDLEEWMDESTLLRRTFRNVALISGLIERNHPGLAKTGKQVTFSSDLIYDTLRRHQPDHVLLRATRADAASGLTDIGRLDRMLTRVEGKITHRRLRRISPLAIPAMLEIGREHVAGNEDDLFDDAEALMAEAVGLEDPG